jgi:hypothetical protein
MIIVIGIQIYNGFLLQVFAVVSIATFVTPDISFAQSDFVFITIPNSIIFYYKHIPFFKFYRFFSNSITSL